MYITCMYCMYAGLANRFPLFYNVICHAGKESSVAMSDGTFSWDDESSKATLSG